ncbi:MAG: transposase [Desulfobacteraceae bacterium]|nr:transposase [Desulfobacteraceae bacterium]
MSRPLRIEFPGAWYYVTNRGRHGDIVFVDKYDYQVFVDLLEESVSMWDIGISAYCLMPNQYHMLIRTPGANISRSMRHINGLYTQRYNRAHDFDGPLFRGRFKSILIEEGDYLLEMVKYIHRYPKKEKMIDQIDRYPWSSHPGYLSKAKKWDWLNKKIIFSLISDIRRGSLKAYRQAMRDNISEDILRVFSMKKFPAILGEKSFIKWVRNEFYAGKSHRQVPDSAILAPDVDWIKIAVSNEYRVDESELMKSRRGIFNEPRGVAIYLTRQLRKDSLEAIGNEFSMAGYSSVSSAIVRMKRQMSKDKKLPQRIEKIKSRIINR